MTAVMHQPEISDATVASAPLKERCEMTTVASAPLKVSSHDFEDHQEDLLTEEMLEQFYCHGISDEFLAAQAKAEARAFDTKSKEKSLAPAVRTVSFICLQRMVASAGLEMERYYEAVTLFDLYCLRCETDAAELQQSLPVLCGAILRLVAKQQNQCACVDGVVLEVGLQFTKTLTGTFNLSPTPVTIAAVNKKEMEVLETVEWKVALPTVHSWSVAILGRFSAVTRQKNLPCLSWLWQHHTAAFLAQMIQIVKPSELAPRHMAVGVFAIGLARANMLPINILFPEDDEARKHFLESQPEGFKAFGDCDDDRCKVLVQQVEVATGAPIASIRKHCHAIMMLSSLWSRTRMNLSCAGA